MKKFAITAALLLAAAGMAHSASATVITYNPADLTTPGNSANDATGVWFNAKTGFSETRLNPAFPTPLFEDGKYMLRWNTGFTQFEAEVLVEGLFSRGNDLFTDATGNSKKFAAGTTLTASSGIDGVIYTDLGPTFGNWQLGDYGFLGLIIGNGTDNANVNYGYAEITVNPDASITLHSFAWNDTPGAPITTVFSIPEPTALAALAFAPLALRRRR